MRVLTSNQCNNMFTFNQIQKEILTSALKLKLSQLTKLEKKIKNELGDEADAAKAVLKEISLLQELFREIELSKSHH